MTFAWANRAPCVRGGLLQHTTTQLQSIGAHNHANYNNSKAPMPQTTPRHVAVAHFPHIYVFTLEIFGSRVSTKCTSITSPQYQFVELSSSRSFLLHGSRVRKRFVLPPPRHRRLESLEGSQTTWLQRIKGIFLGLLYSTPTSSAEWLC